MATENSVPAHAEQVAHVVNTICTRTLNHFAEEAKTNGESLKDAFERYEIDYAWHVLASDRMRERTVAALQAKHQCAVTEAQKAGIADILDGRLARARGAASPYGKFIDSTLDRFVETAAFLGFAVYFAERPWGPLVVAAGGESVVCRRRSLRPPVLKPVPPTIGG